MRNLILVCLCAFVVACSAPELTVNDISGRWDMDQVTIGDENVTSDLDPHSDRWLQLNPDGTFASGGGDTPNTGTYTFEDAVLSLDSDAGEGDDSEWSIRISGDSLIMEGIGTERQQESRVNFLRMQENTTGLVVTTYPIKGNFRALEVVDENTVWYGGAGGQFGLTEDGGISWYQDSIVFEGTAPHFRSLAVTSNATFLLSIASPALLFKSTDKGRNWELVYRDDTPEIFYDTMEFWDDQEGIAMGDELGGCVAILITRDGGDTWNKIPCEELPPAMDGEGFFAASDTNIAIKGDEVWVGSTKSRVYYSPDRGKTWEIQDTPIVKGGRMTGIFSMAMYDNKTGIVFGGDWEKMDEQKGNKAITRDGGKTWTLTSDGSAPGFRSCVRYIPGSEGRELLVVGIPGISYSHDGGNTWVDLSKRNAYALRFTPSGKYGWISGADLIGRVELHK